MQQAVTRRTVECISVEETPDTSKEPDLETEVCGQQDDKYVQCDGGPYQGIQRAKAPCLVIQLHTDGRKTFAASGFSAEIVTSSRQVNMQTTRVAFDQLIDNMTICLGPPALWYRTYSD